MFGAFLAKQLGAHKATARAKASGRGRRYQCDELATRIQLGEDVLCVLNDEFPDVLKAGDNGETIARFPSKFWKYFVETHLGMSYCTRQRLRCYRAAMFVIAQYDQGVRTHAAMRDGASASAKRRKGAEYNAAKARGLGHALLQVFVDEFQMLRSRVDSGMLLSRARDLCAHLVESGFPAHRLPNLDGKNGKSWMCRWRKEYSISKKACGMQLKVSWAKVIRRCQVLLTNIFRVRAFWEHCHPNDELRFISADQKPSWFNNSGRFGTFGVRGQQAPSIRENFAKTRERYSLLTFVVSDSSYQPSGDASPPPLFILFKGKKEGRIKQNVLEKTNLPDWLRIQVQECGSYREEDVIEALEKVLPVCTETRESSVLLLDWYSAHRSEKVVNFIEERGHVVLFHGGGCTPFTQVNDTHLHALLQKYLVQLENHVLHAQRADMHEHCLRGIPTLHRHEICQIAQTAWMMIPHGDIARTGYRQTGPLLPAVGPIRCGDVYKDLQTVLNIIDPPVGEQEIGQRLRDDAYDFVRSGIPTKWSNWTHVKRLIIEQDGEEDILPEGLECMDFDYGEDSDDDNLENSEDDDGAGDNGDDDDGGGGGGGGTGCVETAVVDSTTHPVTASAASSVPRASVRVVTEDEVSHARNILIMDARSRKDDLALRRLLQQRDKTSKHKKDASTDVALTLQTFAKEAAEATRKKREHSRKEQQQARVDVAKAEQLKAEASARQDEIRLQILRESVRRRDAELKRKEAAAQQKATQTYLQTEYSRELARRLSDEWTYDKKVAFRSLLKLRSKVNWFRYVPHIADLWDKDNTLLVKYGTTMSFDGTMVRTVRCSAAFDSYLEEAAPKSIGGIKDPINALSVLLDAAAPGSPKHVFVGSRSLLRCLHMNSYVLDKTFVFCIVALSKWLGKDDFPQGIYMWPPIVQADGVSTAPSASSSSSTGPCPT